MRLLAMDLSLNCPGFAVLEIEKNAIKLLDKATVNNVKDAARKKDKRKSTARKLQEIARQIHFLIMQYKPDVVVRERGFSRHTATTQKLFRVIGVSDLIVYDAIGLEVVEIPPPSVKEALTRRGSADKSDVARVLPLYVGDQFYATDDESDAVAVGIAWAIQNGLIKQKLTDDMPKRKRRVRRKTKKETKTRMSNTVYVRKTRIYC